MKIIFDNIVFALQKSGGISVVWYELLSRIMKSCYSLQYINYRNENLFFKELAFKKADVFMKNNSHMLFIKRFCNPTIDYNHPFIFHSSYYRTCKNPNAINITTVHDFTYEYYECGLKRWLHSWQKNHAIRNSNYIICISKNTKLDLLRFLPDVDERKIKVVYNGVSNDYYRLKHEFKLKVPFEPKKYILFVGARNEYKNFKLSVQAISKTDFNLVIVGPPLVEVEKTFVKETLNNDNRYYCTGRISNSELNKLYNCAYALLYPSAYEGFGIPVIEAQKSGCPVIAYNGSSIPEIIGETPLLLNILSVDEVVNKINLLKDVSIRNKIIEKGFENSKRFSWDRMYEQVIEIYEEAWLKSINLINK